MHGSSKPSKKCLNRTCFGWGTLVHTRKFKTSHWHSLPFLNYNVISLFEWTRLIVLKGVLNFIVIIVLKGVLNLFAIEIAQQDMYLNELPRTSNASHACTNIKHNKSHTYIYIYVYIAARLIGSRRRIMRHRKRHKTKIKITNALTCELLDEWKMFHTCFVSLANKGLFDIQSLDATTSRCFMTSHLM